MKTGKKMLESRVDEFCRNSSELLQNIHSRCGNLESRSGQPKKSRKKRAKKK